MQFLRQCGDTQANHLMLPKDFTAEYAETQRNRDRRQFAPMTPLVTDESDRRLVRDLCDLCGEILTATSGRS
jgi:hypothetical protein